LTSQIIIPISDDSRIGEARRLARQTAMDAGFNEVLSGQAAIIASELATNQSRYASGGEIHLSSDGGTGGWIDIVAVDRGPGMSDVPACLQDGYSTGGTPGTGLGAARRMASEFDVFSTPRGTVVSCRLNSEARPQLTPFRWAVSSRPAPFENVSGDSWRIASTAGRLSIEIVDGLGHGPDAAAAAAEATSVFDSGPFRELPLILEHSHARMRGTRGGALAVAHIDLSASTLRYGGVGNIVGHLCAVGEENGRGLCSHNGTVGLQVRKIQEFSYDCPQEGLLIMHSDGLQTRWSFAAYPGLSHRHPATIAAVLARDFTRGKDDVTLAVVRFSASEWEQHHAA